MRLQNHVVVVRVGSVRTFSTDKAQAKSEVYVGGVSSPQVLVILLITCAEISIACITYMLTAGAKSVPLTSGSFYTKLVVTYLRLTYFQLTAENYNWWWRQE